MNTAELMIAIGAAVNAATEDGMSVEDVKAALERAAELLAAE